MITDLVTEISGVSLERFIVLLQEHQILIPAILPFFAGEFSVHLFGILYGSGDISIVPAIVAVLGMVVYDTVIYGTMQMLQRSNAILRRLRSIQFFTKFELFFKKHEDRYSKSSTLLLVAVKLMPMTKFTLIFFSLCQKMTILQFIIRDIIITTVWMTIVFLPGWLVGKELLTEEAGRQVSTFVLYFLLLIVLALLFGKKIDKGIMRVVDKVANMLDKRKQTN